MKYLFIVIPGTFAGEWLLEERNGIATRQDNSIFGYIPLVLIISNLVLLLERHLFINFVFSVVLCLILMYNVRKSASTFLKNCVNAGSYCLLLGLCLEAYEGGIRKDGSTYSYYFVTSGLAFFSLVFFKIFRFSQVGQKVSHFLALHGQNPMVAYVAGSLLVLPILHLTGLISVIFVMDLKSQI